MKTSTVFIILGVAAIGGYAAYKLLEKDNKKQSDKVESKSELIKPQTQTEKKDNISSEDTLETVVDNLKEEKLNIQNDIVQRHDAAAKIMKDSMEQIMSDDIEKEVSENTNELDEIDDALDKLLDD